MTPVTGAASDDGVPRLVPPMTPAVTSGDPPTGPDWRVEVAWTGHRCVAYVHPPAPGREGRVRLLSGADNSMTHAYPEFSAPLLARCPPGGMVLDGTIVARGEEHASRPRLLQRRHSRYKPSEHDIAAVPVDLQVADLLFFDGRDTTGLPYRERRALLEGLGLDGAPVWTTALFPATELGAIMRIAAAEGIDAFHARHLGARYRPGGRSKFWLRVPVQRTRQVVIGGWTPTDPHRPDRIGTLLLGVPDGDRLRYVGRVGIGVDERRRLDADLRGGARDESPFTSAPPDDVARHAVWVLPDLVGLVEFTGWVGGTRMRLPLWRGLARLDDLDDSQWAVPPTPAAPVRPDQAASGRAVSDRSAPGRAGSDGEGSDGEGPDRGGAGQTGSDQERSGQTGSDQTGIARDGAEQAGSDRVAAGPAAPGSPARTLPSPSSPPDAAPVTPAAAASPPPGPPVTGTSAGGASVTGTSVTGTSATGTSTPGVAAPAADPAAVASPAGRATPPASDPHPTDAGAPPTPAQPAPPEVRRLEQHFVYNSLNTIAALIRTDPFRARELLFGFADLSRAADGPPESTVAREIEAVRAYLQIEQARFGPRLRVEIDLDTDVASVPVPTMAVLAVVREAVQKGIEPRREGGLLSVAARRDDAGCEVAVTAAGETARLRFAGPGP